MNKNELQLLLLEQLQKGLFFRVCRVKSGNRNQPDSGGQTMTSASLQEKESFSHIFCQGE
jgi:hypothetical protein